MSGKDEAESLCRGKMRRRAYVGEKRGGEPMSGKYEPVRIFRRKTRQ